MSKEPVAYRGEHVEDVGALKGVRRIWWRAEDVAISIMEVAVNAQLHRTIEVCDAVPDTVEMKPAYTIPIPVARSLAVAWWNKYVQGLIGLVRRTAYEAPKKKETRTVRATNTNVRVCTDQTYSLEPQAQHRSLMDKRKVRQV